MPLCATLWHRNKYETNNLYNSTKIKKYIFFIFGLYFNEKDFSQIFFTIVHVLLIYII